VRLAQVFDRYVAKEILLPYAAAAVFLSQILLATQLLSESELLFGSGVSAADAAVVALALTPHLLGFVLPIAFLLGAVIGLGRLAEDREIIALGAAGVSPLRLYRMPIAIALATAVLALALAQYVEPAAFALVRDRVARIVKRKLTNDVRAGVFYDRIPGYTLYAERVRLGRWENVLISDETNPASPVLALATTGGLEPAGTGSEMVLVLRGGELHSGEPAAREYLTAGFDRAEAVIRVTEALDSGLSRSARGASFAELPARERDQRARGDVVEALRTEAFYHRRIAQALAVLPFALLAVPLGSSRRLGRALALSAMILAVVVHYLLLRFGEVLAQRAVLPAWLVLQTPTVVLSAVALVLALLQARRRVLGTVG
jgi:lipopolysaccharide export system permease protein